ncbi:uncharacterized protein LOC106172259 [Lingula anatina]|uniref:Uncharacterized protein LOC106172259 n=1 Tax=Lingula anatina TaxID=7574 RepID=A0A1S3JDU8_LINAN|nr:uncharacterized protein LOC106172259 [Lingula anatina]|eukprot:XP_013408346.1 uncharacterized protein LOC106172259 [Lingula anatina]
MELMDYLDESKWERVPNVNSEDKPADFKKYHVMSHKPTSPGVWSYAVAEFDTGASCQVQLLGALPDVNPKHDPLRGVGNVGMKLGGADGCQVIGLLAYDDCVQYKG